MRDTMDTTAHGPTSHRTIDLGAIDPARSRHGGRRSALVLTDDAVVVGTADGGVHAYDRPTLDERWRADGTTARDDEREPGAIVSATAFEGGVAVGERGVDGEIRLQDGATGAPRWRYRTTADVGDPEKETRFFLPFVVDLVSENDRLYAAARRYERGGSGSANTSSDNSGDDSGSGGGSSSGGSSGDSGGSNRSFESCVYAFATDGTVEWTYRTDASPIALDVRGDRVAVAFNRCPGGHQEGLIVLDADTGTELASWDPLTEGTADTANGDRRIGDLSLFDTGLACTSHADYRGYRLDADYEPLWAAKLATEAQVEDERLYAYPNHCHATDQGTVFITGNTYARESRETESCHPAEHTVFGYTPDGERHWSADVGGFVTEIGTDGDRLVAPCGQNFRTRDPTSHGLRVFDVREGPRTTLATDGIVTAGTIDERTVAAIEEPVIYHDEGTEQGAYRLHVGSV